MSNAIEDLAKVIIKQHEEITELREALRSAALQIEYLHDKFQPTGSGEQVLTQIRRALDSEPDSVDQVYAKEHYARMERAMRDAICTLKTINWTANDVRTDASVAVTIASSALNNALHDATPPRLHPDA